MKRFILAALTALAIVSNVQIGSAASQPRAASVQTVHYQHLGML